MEPPHRTDLQKADIAFRHRNNRNYIYNLSELEDIYTKDLNHNGLMIQSISGLVGSQVINNAGAFDNSNRGA